MANENVVVAKQSNCVLSVEECISKKKGTPYKAIYVTLPNGTKVNVGFCNVYTELALLHAGLKL